MQDMGRDHSVMYDNPTSPAEPKKTYPTITLPMAVLKGLKCTVGDKVSLDLNGVVVSMTQDQYGDDCRIEIREGEAETPEDEAKENE